jgi:hypothetical protein
VSFKEILPLIPIAKKLPPGVLACVDNVSTPIAAVLGDVVTLVILGGLASLFAKFMGTFESSSVASLAAY